MVDSRIDKFIDLNLKFSIFVNFFHYITYTSLMVSYHFKFVWIIVIIFLKYISRVGESKP